ncbi:MAG TPA: LacI family DNA-binding transcriptional regulator [Pseudomonadota bacterium]|jgi:LacI family transcriptional regulator|nr:LacI family DNA-binding transcriptional regulator [Pseudomonadota bacterium]
MTTRRSRTREPDTETAGEAPALRAGKATINDVARLSGVSKKTVSRVINQSPLVHPDTREKVSALMRSLGYVPDPQARGLAFRRSFLVGLVYDNPNAPYVINLQTGVLDTLRGSGFELVVHPCDRKAVDFVDGVRDFVERQKLHGVILLPPVSENEMLATMLREIGCDYVRVASAQLDDASRMVVSSDREVAAEVARYLESLGHREIAMITGPVGYRSADERRAGFVDGLAQRGLTMRPEHQLAGQYNFESGVACGEALLSRTPRPTAIFAFNDEMASGVYRAAYSLGLRIPDDVSVIGFDDSPLASRLWPTMTTVRQPIREMGRRAAAMLLRPGPAPGGEAATVFVPHLAVRDSCRSPSPR